MKKVHKTIGAILLLILISYNFNVYKNKRFIDETDKFIRSHNDTLILKAYLFLKKNMSEKEYEKLVSKSNSTYSLIADLKFSIQLYRNENRVNSFEDFCEYVLPPMIYDEKIEDWRSVCYNQFYPITSQFNIYEICDTINKILGQNFMFKHIAKHQYNNWSSFNKKKEGNCSDMAQIVLYPIRAMGYAATVDYTIAWGNTNGAHAWNVILDSGIWKPFMGLEHEIGFQPFLVWNHKSDISKSGHRYPPKVFRRTFSINQEYLGIRKQLSSKDATIGLFSDLRFKDVTTEYFPTYDITIQGGNEIEDKVLFLNVFNNNKWKPIAATLITKRNTYLFRNLRPNMLYFTSSPGGRSFHNTPFILRENGNLDFLYPNKDRTESVEIEYLYPRVQEYLNAYKYVDWSCPESTFNGIAEDYDRIRPKNGVEYELYYYELGWQKLTVGIAKDNTLFYHNIPTNTLFKIKNKKGEIQNRPFTIKNGKCEWW